MDKISYKLLSKYRSQLMGLAMLWIMLYHAQGPALPHNLDIIRYAGFGGVDIFIFLSGFGLYVSLSKNSDFKLFLKHRLKRVLPAFLIVVTLYSFVVYFRGFISVKTIIMNITTLYYWFNTEGGFNWYIPALLFLYMIAPIYFKLFNKYTNKVLFTCISVLIALCIGTIFRTLFGTYLIFLLSRIPIFLIGFLISYYFKKDVKISNKMMFIYLLFGVLSVVLYNMIRIKSNVALYGYYAFLIGIVPACIFIAKILEVFNFKTLNNILDYIGTNSLYIYLINVCMTRANGDLVKYILINDNYFIYHIICFCITLLLAELVKYGEKLINNMLRLQ